jgi:3-oxoacyl-[acyl-carrier protein] reductase
MPRTTLITGASAGIGRETAVAFARTGLAVGICYNADEAGARETASLCPPDTPTAVTRMDVTDPDSIASGLKEVESALGPVYCLINNAGIAHKGPFTDLTPEQIREQVEVNLLGLMSVTAAVLPGMLKRGEGAILNVASAMTLRTHPGASVYTATKHGVLGFTQALASELPEGVRAYTVSPAMTSTRMTDWKGADPAEVAGLILKVAEGELGGDSGEHVRLWEYLA